MQRRDIAKALALATGPVVLSRAAVAQTCTPPCYSRTAAEIAAGVTPTNYAYPEGHLSRYGAVNDGVTDNNNGSTHLALQQAINVCQKNGQSIQGLPGVYRFTVPLNITSCLTISPATIAGPRVYAPAGGGSTMYGGIEFLFDPPSNPPSNLLQSSFAFTIITGSVGAEGYARVRLIGIGIAWTQVSAGGIYIQGAVDVGVQDCWLTGGITNYPSANGIAIYCKDAIVSHFQRNTCRYAGFGIVSEDYWNENEISRNDFVQLVTAGVVIRGKAGASTRSSIRSNNFLGDGSSSMKNGVYVSGTANAISVDENTFEDVTINPVAVSNVDLLDSSNNGTPTDIHIAQNTFIATNQGATGAAIALVAVAGATCYGNSLLSPTSNVSALYDVASTASNVAIFSGNDAAGKPLVIGTLSACAAIDDVLYRTMPTDSSESAKSSWTNANAGAMWWNATMAVMRIWTGGNAASIQPCAVLQLATNSATPAITGINLLELQYTSATNITNLTGGFVGQEVTIVYLSGSAPTIANGVFVLQGATNFTMAPHNTLTVVWDGSNWWEKSRKT